MSWVWSLVAFVGVWVFWGMGLEDEGVFGRASEVENRVFFQFLLFE